MSEPRTFHLQLAVVEWRRLWLPFFDYRGRIAEALQQEFGDVSFNVSLISSDSPIFAESLQIDFPDSTRQALVDGRQVRVQETIPVAIESFATDAARFLEVTQRFGSPLDFSRVGILFVFAGFSNERENPYSSGTSTDVPDGWQIRGTSIRAESEHEGWGVVATVNSMIQEDGESEYFVREVSIDQFGLGISQSDTQAVDIIAKYESAIELAQQLARGSRKVVIQ